MLTLLTNLFPVLKPYVWTVKLAVVLLVAAALTGLYCKWQNEVKSNAVLQMMNRGLQGINSQQALEINGLVVERDALSQQMTTFSKEQQKTIEGINNRLRKTEKELSKLRRQYEDVDAYLNIPVPIQLPVWLREQGSSTGGDSEGVPSGGVSPN